MEDLEVREGVKICFVQNSGPHPPTTQVQDSQNKLTKARKMRKPPGTLDLKKFGPGKLWVEKVWAQNVFINFLAELDHSKKLFFETKFLN